MERGCYKILAFALLIPLLATSFVALCATGCEASNDYSGQSVTVNFNITYQGNPLEGANIMIVANDFNATVLTKGTTDSNGTLSLTYNLPGRYGDYAYICKTGCLTAVAIYNATPGTVTQVSHSMIRDTDSSGCSLIFVKELGSQLIMPEERIAIHYGPFEKNSIVMLGFYNGLFTGTERYRVFSGWSENGSTSTNFVKLTSGNTFIYGLWQYATVDDNDGPSNSNTVVVDTTAVVVAGLACFIPLLTRRRQ
jgi:hypothetical protein